MSGNKQNGRREAVSIVETWFKQVFCKEKERENSHSVLRKSLALRKKGAPGLKEMSPGLLLGGTLRDSEVVSLSAQSVSSLSEQSRPQDQSGVGLVQTEKHIPA